MSGMNCARCNTPLTPDTNKPIVDIEFCPDCEAVMRKLMRQFDTPELFAKRVRYIEEQAKLAAWNAWAKGGQV